MNSSENEFNYNTDQQYNNNGAMNDLDESYVSQECPDDEPFVCLNGREDCAGDIANADYETCLTKDRLDEQEFYQEDCLIENNHEIPVREEVSNSYEFGGSEAEIEVCEEVEGDMSGAEREVMEVSQDSEQYEEAVVRTNYEPVAETEFQDKLEVLHISDNENGDDDNNNEGEQQTEELQLSLETEQEALIYNEPASEECFEEPPHLQKNEVCGDDDDTCNAEAQQDVLEFQHTRPDLLSDHQAIEENLVPEVNGFLENEPELQMMANDLNSQENEADRNESVDELAIPDIAKDVEEVLESANEKYENIDTEMAVSSESGVFENSPTDADEAVNNSEHLGEAEIQKGLTKDLVSQWQHKSDEQFVADKKQIIIDMSESGVAENEPMKRREDVVGHDSSVENVEITKGQTELIKQQLLNKPENTLKESKPIKLPESSEESSVVENTPVKRSDVAREEDRQEEMTCLKKGFAKDLAGFWSSPKNETLSRQVKQPIELPRDNAVVSESTPQRLEGVIRSDDVSGDPITVEHGRAKMMVDLFQNKKEETVTKELKLDINFQEPGVYENNPQERQGVIRSSDVVDEVVVQKGVIKSITGKFLSKEDDSYKPRDIIRIEPAHGPSVIENEPEPLPSGIVRSDARSEEALPVVQGMTRNLVHKWKTSDLSNSKSSSNKMGGDPSAVLEAGKAPESGVFENQPAVRNDVVREEDHQPDVISCQKTRITRDLWNQKINQDSKPLDKVPQLIRFTPPRELSPHRETDETYKSFQKLTLA